jgi:hypothetical protein
VFVAGEADGSDPGPALMDENPEDQEVQHTGRSSILWAVAGCCGWFEDAVDAGLLRIWRFRSAVEAG